MEFLNVFGTVKCYHVHHILLIWNPKTCLFISKTSKASYVPVADASAHLLYKRRMSAPVADASANPLCERWQDFTSPAQPIRSCINLHQICFFYIGLISKGFNTSLGWNMVLNIHSLRRFQPLPLPDMVMHKFQCRIGNRVLHPALGSTIGRNYYY
jgi:hypothetical protein